MLCHIKIVTAFVDAQITVAKDIMENKKVKKDRDAAYKKSITWDKSSFISEIFADLTLWFTENPCCCVFFCLVTLKRPIKSDTVLLFFWFYSVRKRPIKLL